MKLVHKKSGESFDAPRGIALSLIDAGVALEYVEPAPPPINVEWTVRREDTDPTEEPFIFCRRGSEEYRFHAQVPRTTFFQKGLRKTIIGKKSMPEPPKAFGVTCPKNVFDRFRELLDKWHPEQLENAREHQASLANVIAGRIDDEEPWTIAVPKL